MAGRVVVGLWLSQRASGAQHQGTWISAFSLVTRMSFGWDLTFSQSPLPRLWSEGRLEGKMKALQAAYILNSEACEYDPWQRETKASNQLIMGKQWLFPGCGWGQCNHNLENGRGSQQNQRARLPPQERQEKSGLTARMQEGATGKAMWPLAAGKSWGKLPGRNEASSM